MMTKTLTLCLMALKIKVVRERFTKYMEMVKAYDKEVPLRSGDDSEVFYERFGKLEEIYNLYNNAMLVTDDAKKDSLQKKKNDQEAADEIRRASLGKIKSNRVNESLSDSESDLSIIKESDESSKKSNNKTPVDFPVFCIITVRCCCCFLWYP